MEEISQEARNISSSAAETEVIVWQESAGQSETSAVQRYGDASSGSQEEESLEGSLNHGEDGNALVSRHTNHPHGGQEEWKLSRALQKDRSRESERSLRMRNEGGENSVLQAPLGDEGAPEGVRPNDLQDLIKAFVDLQTQQMYLMNQNQKQSWENKNFPVYHEDDDPMLYFVNF